jgi:hypothetical protein
VRVLIPALLVALAAGLSAAGAQAARLASFRFCVQALDASLNQGAKSCARYTFLMPNKK